MKARWNIIRAAIRRRTRLPQGDDLAPSVLRSLWRRHADFAEQGVPHALIGGCALVAHRVVRATEDVDFLVAGDHEEWLHAYMVREGFEALQRTANVSNYLAANGERVDFVYARRAYSLEMLAKARLFAFGPVSVPVAAAEDLIGLKVQAYHNEGARRSLDMDDILRLLREYGNGLDMARVRQYFVIFDREGELDALLQSI